MKNQYIGGVGCTKRGDLDNLLIKERARARKSGGVFEGGWYPNAHYGQ